MSQQHPITPPPPHLLKKFSAQAQDETKKRNGAGYLKTFATLCIEWAMNCESTSNDRQIRSSEIDPSDELVGEWLCSEDYPWAPLEQASVTITTNRLQNVATQAAQWGADQELEACIDVLGGQWEWDLLSQCTGWKEFRDQSEEILRAARRPKPPSLAKRALHILGTHGDLSCAEHATLARALEQLDD